MIKIYGIRVYIDFIPVNPANGCFDQIFEVFHWISKKKKGDRYGDRLAEHIRNSRLLHAFPLFSNYATRLPVADYLTFWI